MTPSPSPRRVVIVMADDDHEDRELAREAFEESTFRTVGDGVELEIVELPRYAAPE
jgi:hypothetical protein